MKSVSLIRFRSVGRSRTAFFLSTAGAILIVMLGWLFTVSRAIGSQVEQAKGSLSATADQARLHLKQTQQNAQPVTQEIVQMKEEFSKRVETANTINATRSFLLEHIKAQIEARPTIDEQEITTYGEEASESS